MIAFVWASGRGSLGFAAPIVFGLGVFVFAFERGAISRVLTAAPFRLMGELSYSIYMTAFFIALAFNIRGSAFAERYAEVVRGRIDHDGHSIATFAFGPPGAMDGLALIYLGVVVAVSFATYRLVEDPARRLANRIAKGVETGTGRARQKIA
jgi:peptidoglycan/LPS O-acetylase OafA/YrhL